MVIYRRIEIATDQQLKAKNWHINLSNAKITD